MAEYRFPLPDVSEGVAEAEIVAWHVKAGDLVAEDQPLVDVMTDKATVEITSPVAGRVVSLHGEAGATCATGSLLVVFDLAGGAAAPGETAPATETLRASPEPIEAEDERSTQPRNPGRRSGPAAGVQRALASPAVRRRAAEAGILLQSVRGSGPAGRITDEDLDAFLAEGESSRGRGRQMRRDQVETVKVQGLRRRIAERMSEAKRRIPHFSYIEEVDVTDLERLRAELNAAHADIPRLTLLPFLARALSQTLPDFPQINATYDDEQELVHRHAAMHLGVATQTAAGLVVPVVRHAESLDLWAFAAEVARLAQAARSGKASRDELSGSTITITSLGPLGGLATTPVINRPEVAIVGPNRIIPRPVVVEGAVAIRKMMNLSCSFDHRVVDGWEAAEFVQRLKSLLEGPAFMFANSHG